MEKMMRMVTFAGILGMSAQVASAATAWKPTSGDVDTLTLEFLGGLSEDAGFALFSKGSNVNLASSPLLSILPNDEITFTLLGNSTWEIEAASNPGVTANLGTMNGFKFGFSPDATLINNWQEVTTFSQQGPDTYAMDFPSLPAGTIFAAVDVTPVPVPTSVVLFAAGLLGLLSISRRRGI